MNKQKSNPPKIFLRILQRFPLYEEMFGISRDFEIEYADISARRGTFAAIFWLSFSILSASFHYFILVTNWKVMMFKNYTKIAFRNLKKHKIFSLINIFGLAIGMAACLLMLMYVVSETSYDNFHENEDQVYRITADWGEEGNRRSWAGTMPGISPTLKEEVSEIRAAARVRNMFDAVVSKSKDLSIKETAVFYADPDIFNILTWPLLQGKAANVLAEPFSLVLSEKTAAKYFGSENPIGDTLNINDNPYKITGIMKDLPKNTHLKVEFLVSYSTAIAMGDYPDKPWDVWGDDYNYILMEEHSSAAQMQKRLHEVLAKNASKWIAAKMSLKLQPLSEIHWDSRSRADIGPKGNYLYVYLFLSLSALVLLIACFNFMNLSTARYLDRMREVGIRKVVGANRTQLIHQFLTESLLVSLVAAAFGVYLFTLLKSSLYTLLNIEVLFSSQQFIFMGGIVVLLVISVGLMAGIYPALFLSRFRPVDIINTRLGGAQFKSAFRQILVVVQYSISIMLITGSMIVYQQIEFMKNSDLGFEKENVVLVTLPYNNQEVQKKYPVLIDQLLAHSSVLSVTGAYTVPGINSNFQMSVRKTDTDSKYSLQILPGDFGYLRTMGLKLVQGRDFNEEFGLDARESVILNETAVNILGFEEPIGEKLIISDNREMVVVGVVKDFHVKSLHNKISPMMIYIDPKMYGTLAIKIKPGSPEDTLLSLKATWESVLPFADFNTRTMEDAYYRYYRTEEKTGSLITIFTCLALLVSCLGLFGLAAFTASKRVKETGIRKILGATPMGIAVLLTRQFTQWVLISNLVAWPTAYYLMSRWLDNFAYRMNLSFLPFLFGGAAALSVAVLTVSLLTIKAAVANPVESLRYE